MVKKMIVVLSAVALIITAAGMAGAFFPGCAMEGDMIVIPMKVTTTFERKTGPGGFASLFAGRDCPQYTNDFFPWGTWRAVDCRIKTEIKPPKCVAPSYGGPVAWGAPAAVMPGCKLVSSEEKFAIQSPGCNPCVEGGLNYSIVKKQVVK
jgi:hypothetical protein